jgi:hypothetical protein
MAGRIVLSIGAASGTDDDHFGNLPRDEYDAVKTMLDDLHKRKNDLADEVLILNVDGYIGESTRSEMEYAYRVGKKVRFLEGPKLKDGWVMPAPPAGETCPNCGRPVDTPVAYDTGDGWELSWDCADVCGEAAATGQEKFFILEWPFAGDYHGGTDNLAKLGFTLM